MESFSLFLHIRSITDMNFVSHRFQLMFTADLQLVPLASDSLSLEAKRWFSRFRLASLSLGWQAGEGLSWAENLRESWSPGLRLPGRVILRCRPALCGQISESASVSSPTHSKNRVETNYVAIAQPRRRAPI